MGYEKLVHELSIRKEKVYKYLNSSKFQHIFRPKHIYDSVYSYMRYGGKALRPSVLLFSCGAVGGDEDKILPAAAAIEVFHTWTMVHDDIIDRDDRRRGGPTIHEEFKDRSINEFGYSREEARHYGNSIAMLAGDMQQGWAVSMLADLTFENNIDPLLVLYLIKDSELRVQSELIEGQVLDIQYSKAPISSITEEKIADVLWKKTGVLYEFCGKAGAMLGLETLDAHHPLVKAISSFASGCGIAFQLQDDILGIVGNELLLGKPVGSDIREGKRTLILCHVYQNANEKQRMELENIVGNKYADDKSIEYVKKMLIDLGGIDYTKQIARSYIDRSLLWLDEVPDSKYKELLYLWAQYMIEREF